MCQDNVRNIQGVLGGGNIIGGVLEGGRYDVRFEFVETRDAGSVWHTHPTYTNGFAFQQFVINHPIPTFHPLALLVTTDCDRVRTGKSPRRA